jgi:pantoate--beta-alanine ligase
MEVIRLPADMKAWAKEQKAAGKRIGLVPTMGFFHAGHLSLMRLAASATDKLVVSLFVNPTQFGPGEDFAAYPRNFDQDSRMAAAEGADVLFAPADRDMYPEGFATVVSVKNITNHLCGACRSGHFDGVATVVTKLLLLSGADCAVFGEKDFQQLAVIRRLVADLNMDVSIVGHPIVREADGLAMSSRNSYLNEAQRRTALCLYESLVLARQQAAAGILDASELAGRIREHIVSHDGTAVEYISFVDQRTLAPADQVDEHTRLALAVRIGKVRLIDNGLLLVR